jgi:hypothetical protein
MVKRSHHHGTHQGPRARPARGPQRRRHGDEPGPRARCPGGGRVAPAAGDSPAAAVLAALSAEPAGAAVAVIAARAGISTAATRQALIAHEKAGTATRVKGSRPGIADTWRPAAASAALGDEAPPADAPGADSTAAAGQPDAQPAGSTADASQPAPVTADGTAGDQQAEADPGPGPDPAVTAEAAGNVAAIAQPPTRPARPSRPGTWTSP